MMAVATSIDALAVGVTFAFLGVNVMAAVVVIGVTTFALSFVGVVVGNPVRRTLEKPATVSGRRGARAHRTEDSARAPGRYRVLTFTALRVSTVRRTAKERFSGQARCSPPIAGHAA